MANFFVCGARGLEGEGIKEIAEATRIEEWNHFEALVPPIYELRGRLLEGMKASMTYPRVDRAVEEKVYDVPASFLWREATTKFSTEQVSTSPKHWDKLHVAKMKSRDSLLLAYQGQTRTSTHR